MTMPEDSSAAQASPQDLTVGDVSWHLRRMALPAAIGLFFNTLFNITDTFFAGLISTDAQAALAFSFPLFFIVLSCSVGLAQATTALIASALGAKRRIRARYFAGQAVILSIMMSIVIAVICLPTVDPMLNLLGASGDAFTFAADYSRVIFMGGATFLAAFTLHGMLNATGNTKAFRNSLIGATILNIFLDPAFIYGWFGLPALGVTGIALATVAAQCFSVAYLLFALRGTEIIRRFRILFLIPQPKILFRIISQATPPTANMLSIGAGFFIITFFLADLDSFAVPAYGIALRIEQLFLLLTIGLNIALLATASQNFGARRFDRVQTAYRSALRYGFIIAAIGGAAMVGAGDWLISLFNRDADVIRLGYGYLIAAAILGPFYIVMHMCGSMLQAIKRPAIIAAVGALRLVVAPLLLFWFFSRALALGVPGIWVGLILANAAATMMIWLRMKTLVRRAAN